MESMETREGTTPIHEIQPAPLGDDSAERRKEKERAHSLAALREYMRQTDDFSLRDVSRTRARMKNAPPPEFREALSTLE